MKNEFGDIKFHKKPLREVLPIDEAKKRSSVNVVYSNQKREFGDKNKKKSNSEKNNSLVWFVMTLAVVFLIISVFDFFSKATVLIDPVVERADLNQVFKVSKNSNIENDISFDIMLIEKSKQDSIPSAGKKQKEERARGQVTLFNNLSSSPQNLLIETRLETPDGKIYKTAKAVTIPGVTTKNGQTTPGSVTVEVFADKVGSEYNVGLTDFKIVGFKGTSKYDKFYGRSKTEIKGGFSGQIGVVDDIVLAQKTKEMKDSLKEELVNDAKNSIPEGFMFFEDSLSFVSETKTSLSDDGLSMNITEEAKLYVVLFEEKEITKKIRLILSGRSESQDESNYFINDFSDINFSFINPLIINSENQQSLDFSLKGNVLFVFKTNKDELKNSLAGIGKNQSKDVFLRFETINKAEVSINPFWKRAFPKKTENIIIIENDIK